MASSTICSRSAVDEFVTKLRHRMQKLGIKPRELAQKADVGFPYLYRVLKGEQTPSMEWAERVGAHVGLGIRVVSTKVVEKKS